MFNARRQHLVSCGSQRHALPHAQRQFIAEFERLFDETRRLRIDRPYIHANARMRGLHHNDMAS